MTRALLGAVIMATLALEKLSSSRSRSKLSFSKGRKKRLPAIAGFRELREIVTEQLKVIRAAQR